MLENPQNQENNTEEEVINDYEEWVPDFKFEPKENHTWKQEGPYIVCRSCDLEHAERIGMNKRLVGISKDGSPILKSVGS